METYTKLVRDNIPEMFLREFRSTLLAKHMSNTEEVHADIAKVYEGGGLLEKAKNAYYTAYAHAEKSSKFARAKELSGTIED
jgi:hypothetical protein